MSRLWAALLLVAACRAPRPPLVPSEDLRIARIEENLLPAVVLEGRGAGRPIAERMVHHGVGGVAIAVIEAGRPIWTRARGTVDEETPLSTRGLGLDLPPRATALAVAEALSRRAGDPVRREGERGAIYVHPARGEGAVVLTDTDGAAPFAGEILRAIAAEYGWTGYPGPVVKRSVRLPLERLREYPGGYDVGSGVHVDIALDGDRLTIATPDGEVAELHAEAPDRFFLLARDTRIVFERDADGNVTGLTAYIGGREIRAPRR